MGLHLLKLGLPSQPQLEKMKAHPVLGACITQIVTQMPGDDQKREMIAFPLSRLNFWLATINPNKVPNPDTRAKAFKRYRGTPTRPD
ncbi:MAG: hypothetical protein EPN26_16200 [Rhodospirillales bacterium]|nr:MAG: hypothetical protein EPN26_16200 [Rhodospirillales bacterium]